MPVMISSFNAGFGVGLAVAAPIGPMGLLCIQRTLATGMRSGFATGLGAATVHAFYGTAAVIGVEATLRPLLQSGGWALQLLSAGLLVFFAVRLLRRREARAGAGGDDAGRHLGRHYRSAVFLGLTNPLTFLLLLAAVPALTQRPGGGGVPEMLAGLACGSVAWWLVLSLGVSLVRTRLNVRAMRSVNVLAAICLLGLAGMSVRAALRAEDVARPHGGSPVAELAVRTGAA